LHIQAGSSFTGDPLFYFNHQRKVKFMPVVKLSQDWINSNLICPENQSKIEYVSIEKTGLYILVGKASQGVGTYFLRYKDKSGKTCHQKIGRTSDMTLAEANDAVKVLKAEIALGADPRAEEKARLAVLTLHQFFFFHYLEFAKQNKRSWFRDVQLFVRIDKRFGARRLNEVSRLELQKFLMDLIKEGLAPASANHHIKLAKRLWNLAIMWELASNNPASKIRLLAEDNLVENVLNDEELGRLLAVLKSEKPRAVCQLVLFLMSTGARFNEAAKSKWADVDLENKTWTIPVANAKSKKKSTVPLNESAMAVLNELDTKENSEYLFLNIKTKQPYTTIARSWVALKKKAGIEKRYRIHDLRHGFASMLINSGVSIYMCQKLMRHATISSTDRYLHADLISMQNASDAASRKIMGGNQAKAA
jgi:site-specific recombinase XerD